MVQGSGFTVQKLKEKLIKVKKVQRFNGSRSKTELFHQPGTGNLEP